MRFGHVSSDCGRVRGRSLLLHQDSWSKKYFSYKKCAGQASHANRSDRARWLLRRSPDHWLSFEKSIVEFAEIRRTWFRLGMSSTKTNPAKLRALKMSHLVGFRSKIKLETATRTFFKLMMLMRASRVCARTKGLTSHPVHDGNLERWKWSPRIVCTINRLRLLAWSELLWASAFINFKFFEFKIEHQTDRGKWSRIDSTNTFQVTNFGTINLLYERCEHCPSDEKAIKNRQSNLDFSIEPIRLDASLLEEIGALFETPAA